jgi:hypothetical protein
LQAPIILVKNLLIDEYVICELFSLPLRSKNNSCALLGKYPIIKALGEAAIYNCGARFY